MHNLSQFEHDEIGQHFDADIDDITYDNMIERYNDMESNASSVGRNRTESGKSSNAVEIFEPFLFVKSNTNIFCSYGTTTGHD